jgi:hypothetical protein
MRNPHYAHALSPIVDDVYYAPVTDANAPLISKVFKFLASRRPGIVAQRFQLADYALQDAIR